MPTRLAVLIDTDNIAAGHAPAVFARISKLGNPVVRRLYGRLSAIASWDGAARDQIYELRPQASISSGKNGADIALTVGAMDILQAGWVDAFCIVSNDRDFVPLAVRLRASRMQVHAICTQFDERLLGVFDTVFDLTSENPIIAAFRKIVSADKQEFGLSEAGTLLRSVAPPEILPPPRSGRLRSVLEETNAFIISGEGSSARIRLKD